MSEQQRIVLAVVLSAGIFIVWTWLFPPPKPPAEPKAPSTAQQESAQDDTQNANAPIADGAKEEAPHQEKLSAKEGTGLAQQVPPSEQEGSIEQAPSQPQPVVASTRSFENESIEGELRNLEPTLTTLRLRSYSERLEEDGPLQPVSLADEHGQAKLDLRVGDKDAQFDWSGEGLLLQAGAVEEDFQATLQVQPDGEAHALRYTLSVTNQSAAELSATTAVTLALKNREVESSMFAPPANMLNALCPTGDEVERFPLPDLLDPDEDIGAIKGAVWAGIDRQYFVVAIVPEENRTGLCTPKATKERLEVQFTFDGEPIAPGQTHTQTFTLFTGPKRSESLTRISPLLADAIDYSIWGIPLGFLARPMVFLMNIFHGWTSSWGLAIIFLTFTVKLLLFPVTYKSIVSMRKMQLLKPEMEKIKERHPNDREKQQMEQMKLLREKGVNPLGGCLPMLMQMPVWFALYRTLWTAVDLYQQEFLWLDDLTAKEDFPFMALLLGAVTVVQQKVQPMAADSQQAKMMMILMPIMLTVFMINLPSGLVLYILVNSILTIAQQLVINRTTDYKPAKA